MNNAKSVARGVIDSTPSGVITLSSLTKYYGDNLGIEDVSLNIEKGAFYGFIGPNGAGKSTTLRLLMGLIHPTGGFASICGYDCVSDGKALRHITGYLPSEVNLYDNMKVKDFIKNHMRYYKYANFKYDKASDHEVGGFYLNSPIEREKIMNEAFHSFVEEFQLDVEKRIRELSFGNKKKVGIITSLIHDPDVLILDEPTGGLDPIMQERFFEMLKRKNDQGKTIFFSSHILSEIEKSCKNVALIQKGKIIRSEDVQLLKERFLKKITVRVEDDEVRLGLRRQLDDSGIILKENGKDKNVIVFDYRGRVKELLTVLSCCDIDDLIVENPSLEDVFKHYYMEE